MFYHKFPLYSQNLIPTSLLLILKNGVNCCWFVQKVSRILELSPKLIWCATWKLKVGNGSELDPKYFWGQLNLGIMESYANSMQCHQGNRKNLIFPFTKCPTRCKTSSCSHPFRSFSFLRSLNNEFAFPTFLIDTLHRVRSLSKMYRCEIPSSSMQNSVLDMNEYIKEVKKSYPSSICL